MAKRKNKAEATGGSGGRRFIDNDEVKELVAELHMLQLRELLERLRSQVIEPAEMKLIWDMVKTHSIGIDGVSELVESALSQAATELGDLEFDESWSANL